MPWRAELSFRIIIILTAMMAQVTGPLHTAGALHIVQNGNFTMDGGLSRTAIRPGQAAASSQKRGFPYVSNFRHSQNCYATWGGGMLLEGEAGAFRHDCFRKQRRLHRRWIYTKAPVPLADTLIEGNYSAL